MGRLSGVVEGLWRLRCIEGKEVGVPTLDRRRLAMDMRCLRGSPGLLGGGGGML